MYQQPQLSSIKATSISVTSNADRLPPHIPRHPEGEPLRRLILRPRRRRFRPPTLAPRRRFLEDRDTSPSPRAQIPLAFGDDSEDEVSGSLHSSQDTPKPQIPRAPVVTDEDIDMDISSPPRTPFAGFPTADEFKASPPTEQDKNPYQKLPAFVPESPEESRVASKIQTNAGEWDAAILPWARLTENLSEAAVADMEKLPDRHLLIVPFLGGKYFNEKYGTAAAPEIKEALLPLAGPEGGLLVVALKAKDVTYGERDNKFTPPLAMIARVAPVAVRDKIVRFPLVPILAFRTFSVAQASTQ
ncbi:hypothetical protein B0H14DRAFT_2618469 [Mycena olivaceomarginata]|nr:hypothetical protein B0H14DRAFT_2618469 [Mycena olivaceomarginata]